MADLNPYRRSSCATSGLSLRRWTATDPRASASLWQRAFARRLSCQGRFTPLFRRLPADCSLADAAFRNV